MPTLRHDDARDQLLAGLSGSGRRQLEAFASVYEARQVAAQLAGLRARAQLSQRQVANRAGINQADLSRIESAKIMPSLPTLLRLLDAVGASLLLAPKAPSARRVARGLGPSAVVPATKRAAPRPAPARRPETSRGAAGRGAGPAKPVAVKAATGRPGKATAVPPPTTGPATAAARPAKHLARV